MDSNHFDALARVASSSRRSTVAAMLATAGGLAALTTGEARRKKKSQNCGKKERKRCKADTESCRAAVLADCGGSPTYCEARANCCEECSADGMLTCLLALESVMAAQDPR
jgi:hypothetical protein